MHDPARLGIDPVGESELARQFGPIAEGDDRRAVRDLAGTSYARTVREISELVHQQWSATAGRSPLRGFFLSGPPGTGKTTMIRRVAYDLMLRAREDGSGPVQLLPLDGGHIARSRYGDSEERIRLLFRHAQTLDDGGRTVILLDDVESILMRRGSEHAKEWHLSQDSVFFHVVDELDTRRAVVCLTSNRPDLVDEAILDRFLQYEVPSPDLETLRLALERWMTEFEFEEELRRRTRDRLIEAVASGSARSFRHVERMAVQEHVRWRLGTESLVGRLA